jgi:hypothetical protein
MAIYYAAVNGYIPASNSNSDVFQIAGVAGLTVLVRRIQVSGFFHPGGSLWNFILVRRTSANTGGGPTAMIVVNRDTTDPAASAAPVSFNSLPSGLGTGVGAVEMAVLSTPDNTGQNCGSIMSVREFPAGAEFVLRGTSEYLSFNLLNSSSLSGMSFSIEWEEV